MRSVKDVLRGEHRGDRCEHRGLIARDAEARAFVGLEKAHRRERRARGILDRMRVAVGAHLEDLAVELDHLAVESVKGAEAKVAVSLELAHRHVAGGGAFHQGVDGRGLKDRLVFVAEETFERLNDDR
jgi:hypothetical protein